MLTVPTRMTAQERESMGRKLFDPRLRVTQTRRFGQEKQYEVIWNAEETPLQMGVGSGLPRVVAVLVGTLMESSVLKSEHESHAFGISRSNSIFRIVSTGHRLFPIGAVNEPMEGEVANLQSLVLIVPVTAASKRKLPWANEESEAVCLGVTVLAQAATFLPEQPVTWHYGHDFIRHGYTPGKAAPVERRGYIDLSVSGPEATQGWR